MMNQRGQTASKSYIFRNRQVFHKTYSVNRIKLNLSAPGCYPLRCLIFARMRRFFRPILRRPFPVFLVPTQFSVKKL